MMTLIKKYKEWFLIDNLKLLKSLIKPVVVHSRDSIGETYNILSKYNLKGSIHCFSGSLEMAKLFIKLGYKLGVGGIITFKMLKI